MAYDRLKNNVDAINWAITRNRIGLETEVGSDTVKLLAEDLSNFVDLGKSLSNLDSDTLKSFAKDVISGIARNIFITDVYTAETHGIVKNVEEYNGAIQRIAVKNLPNVQESHARSLISGVNYFDGKFYGMEIDSKIFSDEFDFKIPYSIGYEDIRAKFDNMEWVDKTIASIEVAVRNSLEIKLKGIADTLVNKGIVDAISGGRVVHLVSKFCEYFGYVTDGNNDYTWTQIKASETLTKQFCGFLSMVISLVAKGFTRMNEKYNNGEIPNFTPSSRIRLLGLVEFMKVINNLGYANIFNESMIDKANVDEILCWQSSGMDILPLLTITGTIKDGTFTLNSEGTSVESEDATTHENIVMYMYDSDMMGATYCLDRIGVENIGSELFNTYFHHFAVRQYIDGRNCAVAFDLA